MIKLVCIHPKQALNLGMYSLLSYKYYKFIVFTTALPADIFLSYPNFIGDYIICSHVFVERY